MSWTEQDRRALLDFKDYIDADEIKVKEQIKKILLGNRFITHVLNDKELEEKGAEPDDYFDRSIKSYYMIPPTQTQTFNYICYEVGYKELYKYNTAVKVLQITFHILCHYEDIMDEETGLPRHDLLSALIQDEFNYTTRINGGRLKLVSNLPSTTDNDYATRTLVFEQNTDANLVKTIKGVPYLKNKEVQKGV